MKTRFVAALLALAAVALPACKAQTGAPDVQPQFPIRAAFYYPWFPGSWRQQGIFPYSNFTPTLGYYDSGSPQVIAQHIQAMQYAGLDAGIASWWGPGSGTDREIQTMLDVASLGKFRWSLYYEREGYSDPTVAQIQSDLSYIESNYGNDAGYLRLNGKPVLFVYAAGDGCSMATRWAQADAAHDFYIVLKVFAGYRACADQPDSWHQYASTAYADDQPGYSFSISPGFWKVGSQPLDARSASTWAANAARMVASGEPWQLVVTFNEWGEGTNVESATQWSSPSGYGAYLDALHQATSGG